MVNKGLSLFLKIVVTQVIFSLSGKTLCCKEILNKYFRVENTWLGAVLTMLGKISPYLDNMLYFKDENASCDSSTATSLISKSGPPYITKFSNDELLVVLICRH